MQNIQLIQILLVIAFLALSGLGWLIRKFQEQSEKKRVQLERLRRIEEMLRTGRDPAAEPASPDEGSPDRMRLEELARRRQAQMEQLRREHAQRRQESQRTDRRESELPPIIIMGPSGPIALPRSPQSRPPARTASSPFPAPVRPAPPRPGPQQRPQRPARPQPRPQRRPERPAPRPAPVAAPQPQQRREPPPAPMPGAVIPGGRGPAARPMVTLPPIRAGRGSEGAEARSRSHAAEYRRLVATMEVLKPPLALREEYEPGPVYRAF